MATIQKKTSTPTVQTKTATKASSKAPSKKDAGKVSPKKDAAKNLEDLFEDCLKDALWAENAVKDALPKMAKNATSKELKKALENHLAETKDHVKTLKAVFKSIGTKAEEEKCDAMAGILALFTSCSVTKVKKVNYHHEMVEFTPVDNEKEAGANLFVKVEPIDAQTINNEVFKTIGTDGAYQKEEIFTHTLEDPKRDAAILKKISAQYQAVDDMIAQNKMTINIGILFKQMIYSQQVLKETNWFEGSEANLINTMNWFADFNPYRIDQRYLSMFRLTFTNANEELQEIDIENIQASNGTQQLYPFKNDYFQSVHKDANEKMKYIHRMNMPNQLRILPGQKVVKFISTPALQTYDDLTVSFINDKKVVNFLFEGKKIQTIKEHIFTRYKFTKTMTSQLFIVELPNGICFPVKSNYVYINRLFNGENIKIHGMTTLYSNRSVNVSYGGSTFIPVSVKKGKIPFKFTEKSIVKY